YVRALVIDAARGRLQKLGQQIEAGGLSRAVRSDQGMDRASPDFETDAVDSHKARERFGQIPRFENHFGLGFGLWCHAPPCANIALMYFYRSRMDNGLRLVNAGRNAARPRK